MVKILRGVKLPHSSLEFCNTCRSIDWFIGTSLISNPLLFPNRGHDLHRRDGISSMVQIFMLRRNVTDFYEYLRYNIWTNIWKYKWLYHYLSVNRQRWRITLINILLSLESMHALEVCCNHGKSYFHIIKITLLSMFLLGPGGEATVFGAAISRWLLKTMASPGSQRGVIWPWVSMVTARWAGPRRGLRSAHYSL